MEVQYLCVVRVYRRKCDALDLTGRAVIVCSTKWEDGTPVSFIADGKKYYGDVLSCTEIMKGSALHLSLGSMSELDVHVHNQA